LALKEIILKKLGFLLQIFYYLISTEFSTEFHSRFLHLMMEMSCDLRVSFFIAIYCADFSKKSMCHELTEL